MSQYVASRIATQARDAWRRSHLARHLIEMYLAMQVGMAVGSLLLSVAVGEARQQHPVASLLVMALSMTVPMVAWMLHRGHSRRSAGEMAGAMLIPALPLIGLQLSHVITTTGCGAYMTLSTIAMITLILYRRNEYRADAAVPSGRRGPRAGGGL